MSLSDEQRKIIDEFLNWVAATARQKVPLVGTTRKVEGQGDFSECLVMRLYTDTRTWLEVNFLVSEPKLRIGLATDSRTRNEEGEQLIEDSKDTLDEFLELGLADAGYEDDVYKMEHFHESGIFYFATHLDSENIEAFAEEDGIRQKAMQLVEGYALAFEEMLDEDF